MSKESSETTLISTFLAETEKVIREELPKGERDEVLAKLKKRWEFLNVRSHFDEFMKSYKLKSLEADDHRSDGRRPAGGQVHRRASGRE